MQQPDKRALQLSGRTYKEKILLIGCLLGVVGFIPFTAYRFAIGDFVIAAVELALAICMLAISYFVWRTHQVELSKLSSRDSLTGTGNWRLLDEALKDILNRHYREPLKASLLLIDIDQFKVINDTYGHNIGDEILTKIAELLARVTQNSHQVYRYGGEEFVLIAKGLD